MDETSYSTPSLGNPTRRGTLIIIVAGLAALLVALSVAFLARMRSEAEENELILRETQAHIMLEAACCYIREASRIGYGIASNPGQEAFGWIDVRDGKLGPKPLDKTGDDASRFPIGSVARCPMYVVNRPPFAVQLTVAYNPIDTRPGSNDFGLPLERNPDPQPVTDNGWMGGSGTISAGNLASFAQGDMTPRPTSVNLAWFRVMRISGARFLVTCGSGASDGFRDWNEVVADNATCEFQNDPQLFDDIVNQEVRIWYLVEWSPTVSSVMYQVIDNEVKPDNYQWRPMDRSHETESQNMSKNMAGTIRWIQRLDVEPDSY